MARSGIPWRLAPPVLIAVASIAIGRTVPWREVVDAVAAASWPLLAIVVVATVLALGARIAAWHCLLRSIGVYSAMTAMRASVVGMALNCVLIANAGEPARFAVVRRESRATGAAILATMALERLLVSVPFIVLLIVTGAIHPLPASLHDGRSLALLALGLAMAAWFVVRRRPSPRGVPAPSLVDAPPRGRVSMAIGRFGTAMRDLLTPRRTAAVLGWAVAHWTLQFVALAVTAEALGFAMPVGGSLLALLGMSASGSVRATPGNIGVNQLIYVGTAEAMGLPGAGALAVALVMQVVQTVPVLGAAVLMSGTGDARSSIRRDVPSLRS